ncbi:MAG: hypothetical protein HY918_00565 [Candidatus Doudnabacteria bacterium]|nr:hypothetical protein [Candidatus Doudnabacteria bacterium]
MNSLENSQGRISSSSRKLNELSGVKVPAEARGWVGSLESSFKGLDYGSQAAIIEIIKGFGNLSPEKAAEVAKSIADFFKGLSSNLSNTDKPLKNFLDDLSADLEKEKNKKVQ